jgi:hypothetical protein
MRKLWTAVVVSGLTLGGLGIWAFSPAEGGPAKERHPHIHRALNKLRAAKKDLQTGAHDFGGHRVAAIKDIDRAIAQLEKALNYDKK